MNSAWLPILEYARYKNISISTIRRYIKADRVKTRMEGGKYHIFVANYVASRVTNEASVEINGGVDTILNLKIENDSLKKNILQLQDEISELKMLISLYENKNIAATSKQGLGELPPSFPNIM